MSGVGLNRPMKVCEKCGGVGWVWGHELKNYNHPLSPNIDDTKYSCDACFGKGIVEEAYVTSRRHNMTKDEWISRCAKRYMEIAGLEEKKALSMAEENYHYVMESGWSFSQDPEESADADLDCWDNDE